MASVASDIVPLANADELAAEAARRIIQHIEADSGRPAICLTGGSGPVRLYELLGSDAYAPRIPWERVHWFIGDERFVPLGDKLSNMGTAQSLFLNRRAPASNIHAVPTDAADINAAAAHYEAALRDFHGGGPSALTQPLFTVVLMGIGPDGHTASLFPGNAALNETNRWAVGVAKPNVEPFVPRVTLTFPALASCHEMIFLVSGVEKRAVLARVVAGDDLPATRARAHGKTTWLVDADALGRNR